MLAPRSLPLVSGVPAYGVEDLLFRAALLSGHGAQARALARRLAAVTLHGDGRSCLDAGSPVQLTVDAPGPARLRVGVRLGAPLSAPLLAGLVPGDAAQRLAASLVALPEAAHASLGTWLFWSAHSQSVFVDLRDPSPADAFARLAPLLDRRQLACLQRLRHLAGSARPWVLRLRTEASGAVGLQLHWLLARHDEPERWVDAVVPGAWPRGLEVFGRLLRRPRAAGRWVVATSLDDDEADRAALRIGNSGWSLVPEDERKHRAVGELVGALGGARDHAEALWSLCRGAASGSWRVGRACELKIERGSDAPLRARLFFVPQLGQAATTAGTSSSADDGSSCAAATDAVPSRP